MGTIINLKILIKNKMIKISDLIVQLLHIFIFGPFLIYVGITQPSQDFIYYILLALGIAVIVVFIVNMIRERTKNVLGWLLWHIIIISGILLWCGIQKTKSPHIIFALLIALGFAAIGYHATRFIQSVSKKN
jgi:hypothetical protein